MKGIGGGFEVQYNEASNKPPSIDIIEFVHGVIQSIVLVDDSLTTSSSNNNNNNNNNNQNNYNNNNSSEEPVLEILENLKTEISQVIIFLGNKTKRVDLREVYASLTDYLKDQK
ncbi:hypothetical protein DFA_02336 [Cavenderia fasciculata]|uniref:Uncharacterized protein n=1 Tax=Cavenderia fasciculata TaxID=261658 RepID=F4PZ61_CACFS|nr:uncharacterized protein DFA_02336 [Cavenderia fasciculata]EGG19090.1 hypothetical protein DFA_02336 [Cavenderia fasciculata]|eukprot:XP_004366723.1 hypothetical protein DFA_02336 [Cavenderia fasciculata]